MNVIIEEEVLVPDVPIIEEQVLYPSNPISVEEEVLVPAIYQEVQRQYKESDFQDNPYVDPAWLASRPAPPPYAELRDGSSGQEVLDMKARFLELGYFRTTSFNDRFTDATADTVRLFEKNNSLPVDGIADAVMLGVLFSDGAVGK